MHPVEELDSLLQIARHNGYRIRYEYLGGTGGGVCEYSGQRWLFLDLALNSFELIEMVRKSLRSDPSIVAD